MIDGGRPAQSMKCALCEDFGWVCENHPHKPWEGEHACNCGAAGAPCPWCNQSDAEHPPRMPDGFDERASAISDRGWARELDDPIALPGGDALVTLIDAGNYITELPEAEHEAPEWQAAMEALMLVATLGGRRCLRASPSCER